MCETRIVESVVSDTELVLSSGLSDGIVDGAEFAYQKAIARLSTSEGTTEFVVSSEGQVGLGSHVGEERLTLGSLERSPEVVDVVFRSSSSEDGESERQNAMRLRSGWHNTESDQEGEQRMSIEGYVSDEWSEVVSFRADGHVGIGTYDPLESLHIVGNGFVEGEILIGPLGTRFAAGANGEALLHSEECSAEELRNGGTCATSHFALSVGDKRSFLFIYLSISKFRHILDSHMAPYATCEIVQSRVRRCSEISKRGKH